MSDVNLYVQEIAPRSTNLLEPQQPRLPADAPLLGRLLERFFPSLSLTARESPLSGYILGGVARSMEETFASGDQCFVGEADLAVDTLVIQNPGDVPAFFDAGTMLLGGWQNRMLREHTIVGARAERTAPVYCVEAGRWQPISDDERAGMSARSGPRVPALLLHHSRIARLNGVSAGMAQYTLWERILEWLQLSGRVNPTMNLAIELPRADMTDDPSAPDNARGVFEIDPASGTAHMGVVPPGREWLGRAAADLRAERVWSSLLRKGAGRGRRIFRVFDAGKRIGIQCAPDGAPLKDLHGRFLAFQYEESDLNTSFRPPLGEPPP
ncbi:MAG: hypothetical protein HY042_06865, partial [Spirochaetia bacterium]|nr:hypothetical protein [Spirochaetia bacterium]